MIKKVSYLFAALALAACSSDPVLTDGLNNIGAGTDTGAGNGDGNVPPVETVNKTTRLTFGKKVDAKLAMNAAGSRIIVDVAKENSTFAIDWNDGSKNLLGNIEIQSGVTVNADKDHIEFLDNSGDWAFLKEAQNRQLFEFEKYHQGTTKTADFVTYGTYEGLEPNKTYKGYIFNPFITEKCLPVPDAPEALKTKLTQAGYKTTPVQFSYLMADEYTEDELQKVLAKYYFLEAETPSGVKNIKPSRDGVYNSSTNQYDLTFNMRPAMALVVVDLQIDGTGISDDAKKLQFRNVNLVAETSTGGAANVLYQYAALDAKGEWKYSSDTDPKKSNIVQFVYNNGNATSYSGCGAKNTKHVIRYILLVKQEQPADVYNFQFFCSGTNAKWARFYPGDGFMFEPGKYYHLKFKTTPGNVENPQQWQQNDNMVCEYPTGENLWKIAAAKEN